MLPPLRVPGGERVPPASRARRWASNPDDLGRAGQPAGLALRHPAQQHQKDR
ncbi:MAG: hypothetical protein H5T61_06775 [Thermoflexales bacterium]|nr:hypothetical protein [Thermoflexales bacterium]